MDSPAPDKNSAFASYPARWHATEAQREIAAATCQRVAGGASRPRPDRSPMERSILIGDTIMCSGTN
jgi:hypothetical protein